MRFSLKAQYLHLIVVGGLLFFSLFLHSSDALAQALCNGGGSATGTDSTACGPSAVANSDQETSIGGQAGNGASDGLNTGSTFVGYAAGTNSIGTANFYGGIAAGVFSSGSFNTALGASAGQNTTGVYNVAVGNAAQTFGANNATAIGHVANAAYDGSTAVGAFAQTTAVDQMMFGTTSNTYVFPGLGTGSGTQYVTVGPDGQLGTTTSLGESLIVAEGTGTSPSATGAGSTAAGFYSTAAATNGAAFGNSSNASGANATAIGTGSTAGENSTAVGQGASAQGPNSSAFGQGAHADLPNSTAIGAGASTTAPNQVMLGTASQTVVAPGALRADGHSTLAGGADISAGLVVAGGTTTDTLVVTGSTSLNGPTTIDSSLNVTGLSTLTGGVSTTTLTTTGLAKLQSASVTHDLSVGGLTTTNGITNAGTITSTGNITSSATVQGASLTDGTATINGGNISGVKTITAATANIAKINSTTIQNAGDIETASLHAITIVVQNQTVTSSFAVSPGASVSMGGNVVHDVGAPVSGTDAANKAYVDSSFGAVNSRVNEAFQKIDQNTQGIAIAMAMGGLALPASKTVAIGANVGFYEDKQAVAVEGAVRLGPIFTLNGGIGVGVNDGSSVGGRVGVQAAF